MYEEGNDIVDKDVVTTSEKLNFILQITDVVLINWLLKKLIGDISKPVMGCTV